jgi:glucan-binding YG repeat protein
MEGKGMNKKDLKAVLLASALGGAAFVAPVMAEENSQDPVDVNDQTTQTVPADESTVNEQTTNTESAETNSVADGWSDDGYYYENGQMVVSQFKTIEGKTYYFKWDGSFYKDGAYYIGSDQYYFDVNGVMQTNFEYENKYFGEDGKAVSMQWVQFGNKWRYYGADTTYCTGQFVYMNDEFYAFDDDGFALSGWQKIGDYWYYLTEKGLSLTNQWVDGDMYYVDADGKMVTNRWIDNSSYVGADGKKTVNTWEQVNGKYKYKLGDGTYATQRLILDKGKYYAVDYDGYMVTDGTAYVSNYYAVGDGVYGTVHAGKDGALVKGWYTNSTNITYYFGDNYFAYGTGLYTIEGKQYYFQYESLVKSRNFVYDGKVYIADSNGVVTLMDTTGQTKWVQLNGAWYYLKDGVALTNALEEIDGSYYYFNNEGIKLSSQTFEYDNHKYYADSNGVVAMKKNTWAQTDNGQTIYYKEDGGLVYDTTFTIDNKLYKFSYEGYLERGTVSVYDRDGTKYYLTDESGVINQAAGWKEYRFHWYYAKEGGALYANELTIIGGKSYYFNYSGEMVVNSAQYVGDGLYYFDTNGELVDSVDSFTGTKEFHGLIYLNKDGDRYYTGEYGGRYYSGGVLQQSCIVEDKYYIDFNGKIAKGWIKDGNTYYYGDPTTGVLAKNKWLQINGT